MKKLSIVLLLILAGCNNGDVQPAFTPNDHFFMPSGDVHHVHKPNPVEQILLWDRLNSDFNSEADV